MVNRTLFSGLLVFGLALAAVAVVPAEGPAYIALIAKGSAQEFWQAVMNGAQKAAHDYDVVVTFEGPEDESMVDRQVEMLGAALARNPSAVCIAALDSAAVIPLLEKARAAKIPVIGFDTGVDSPLAVTTAATDNVAAAALAADKMAALIGGWGKVGVVAEDPTSRTAVDRTDGFLRAMRKFHPRVQVIAPRYGGGDVVKTTEIAKAMIHADPDIRGIIAGDEASAIGVMAAVQGLGLAGRMVVIGYDSGKAQVDAIRGGVMAGAVTQDPIRIGYMTVEAAVRIIAGRRVPRRIDTGFHWYDQTNIDDPSIAVLLHQ